MAYNLTPFIDAWKDKKHMVWVAMWDSILENIVAKAHKYYGSVFGKTSRVLTSQGLKYGLSGNRVIKMVTFNYFP